MASDVPFSSPYYPYKKTLPGALTLNGTEKIPYKLLMYLLDLPDAYGYTPADDNTRPRVRLAKYLWYDEPKPLSKSLPTPTQKRSILFDPDFPDINTDELKAKHPKGYRLQWQKVRGQSQTESETLIKCYISKIFERKKFVATIGITFEIWCNVNLETNTRTDAYNRAFSIEQCLHEALDGVNIDGIGTVSFAQGDHAYNGSEGASDEYSNVARIVHCSITWAESGGTITTQYDW